MGWVSRRILESTKAFQGDCSVRKLTSPQAWGGRLFDWRHRFLRKMWSTSRRCCPYPPPTPPNSPRTTCLILFFKGFREHVVCLCLQVPLNPGESLPKSAHVRSTRTLVLLLRKRHVSPFFFEPMRRKDYNEELFEGQGKNDDRFRLLQTDRPFHSLVLYEANSFRIATVTTTYEVIGLPIRSVYFPSLTENAANHAISRGHG